MSHGETDPLSLYPAGMTFTGNLEALQVFYGLYGFGATHSAVFSDITVTGCFSDTDGDTVVDHLDNCPLVANADQADFDGDGIGDDVSDDSDSDGVFDSVDNCRGTANADQADFDSDGVGDVCDNATAVQSVKTALLATLKGIAPADREDAKRIEKAIKEIEKSLNPDYWPTPETLDPKHGDKVFDHEAKAVSELFKLVKDDSPLATACRGPGSAR